MADPFTIRIFVPDGDPEGLRIIDRMNWTGLGIVFPREDWTKVKQRPEFSRPGVYILVGYSTEDEEDDLPNYTSAKLTLFARASIITRKVRIFGRERLYLFLVPLAAA